MKVIATGLPRSGGQTLQKALSILLKGTVVHSPGNNWEVVDDTNTAAAVEVFAPAGWLDLQYPHVRFIHNCRERDPWLESCRKVYQKSQEQNYNNPIWRYPLSQFRAYADDYEDMVCEYLGSRALHWDITTNPRWEPLCDFLDLPIPDVPFPNIDRHGRPESILDIFGNYFFPQLGFGPLDGGTLG